MKIKQFVMAKEVGSTSGIGIAKAPNFLFIAQVLGTYQVIFERNNLQMEETILNTSTF